MSGPELSDGEGAARDEGAARGGGRRLTPGDEARLAKLDALRDLLFEEEQRHIQELERRVTEAEEHARNVSRVLPEAIALRAAEDKQLGEALSPTIEEAIQVSVRKNPKALADAIFPIIGPAIRKSVQAMLAGMMQRLNRALEESFSVRSLRWRLEARRTGRPFAEIVLLNSLVYRVEQVFLIHNETGLLLEHVVVPEAHKQDADVVSGMLSAIRDFVHDSFESQDDDELQTLRVGDLTVAVERGPLATVAALVRGTPPVRFGGRLEEALEGIHSEHGGALKDFDGEVEAFAATRETLASLLLEQRRQPTGPRLSPGLRLAATAAVLIGLVFGVSWWIGGIDRRQQFAELVGALRREPGLVVLAAEREGGRYRVELLRDPDAVDPARVVARSSVSAEDVDFASTEFVSLAPGPVLTRVKRLLDPPRSVSVRLEYGVLSLRGRADRRWIERALQIAAVMPGVDRVDASELGDPSVERLMESRRFLEVLRIRYEVGSLTPNVDDVTRLRYAFLKLDEAAREAGYRAGVNVSASGPLGPERARALADALSEFPVSRTTVNPSIGSRPADDDVERSYASFSVALFDGPVASGPSAEGVPGTVPR